MLSSVTLSNVFFFLLEKLYFCTQYSLLLSMSYIYEGLTFSTFFI